MSRVEADAIREAASRPEVHRRNALVVESAPLGIYGLDREGRTTFVNPAGCRILGYEEDELIGRVMHDVIHHTRESGESYPKIDCPIYAALVDGTTHHVDTEVFWRKDRVSFPVTYMSAPILDGDAIVGAVVVFRDITTRRRAIDDLRESEQRYRALVSALDEGIMLRAPDGRLLSANAAAERITGMTADELTRTTETTRGWRLIREDGAPVPQDEQPGRLAQRTGRSASNMTFGLIRPDGLLLWITMNCAPLIREGATEPYLVVISLTDITARKESEEALRQSEQRFRSLATFAPIGIYWTDSKRRCLYANDRWLEIMGLPLERAKGHGYLSVIHPADRDLLMLADMSSARDEVVQKLRVGRGDGEVRWVLDRSTPIRDASGVVRSIVGTLEDITRDIRERVERETEYRLILENSTDLIARHAPDGSFVYMSPNCQALLGFDPGELVGRSIFDQVHPEDLGGRDDVEGGRKTLADVLPATFRRRLADGTYRWFEATAWTVRAEDTGKVIETVVVSRDISRRRAAEEALRQAEEQFRHSQKMEAVGRLAGGIAHDFNNLLTVILGCSGLLAASLDGERNRKLNDEIRVAADRAAELTRQLLAFGRKQVLAPKVLDPNTAVRDVEPMIRRLVGETIEVSTKLDPNLALVVADPGQLHQCLLNLVVNARDAMPNGGRLTIETRNVDLDASYVADHVDVQPGHYVLIAVSDTGCGIEPGLLSQIFEPFFTTKEPGSGTGLGLSTVYGIVKQSGGNIVAYSDVGRGTSMKIYLPRAAPDQVVEVPPPTIEARPRGTETILLVEDEAIVRKTVSVILGELGYRVYEAAHAVDAREWASRRSIDIDLLLTDVVMPGESGVLLADAVRAMRPSIGVVFMSGYTGGAIIGAGNLSPGQGFLQKPFSPADLAKTIRDVLDESIAARPGGR